MKNDRKNTTYVFAGDAKPEGIVGRLEALGFGWSNTNAYAYPGNAGSTFDGVFVLWGERDDYGESEPYQFVEVALLHPDPDHQSEYWEKFEEIISMFEGIEPMYQFDWREGAREKKHARLAKEARLRSMGRFHVFSFSWETRNYTTVLVTNDPVAAYNAYVALPELWATNERCECKILVVGEEGRELHYYWRDQILLSYAHGPSSFECDFFIRPNLRRGPSYHVRPYAYARFMVYDLLAGRWEEHCAVCNNNVRNDYLDLPHITTVEKEEFEKGGRGYPIQPRLSATA